MSLIAAPAGAALAPRVLAGSQATSAQWPFIAALVQHGQSAFDGQFCGGSVIAPTVVLTAAHCVTGSSAGRIDVVTGRAQLSASQLGQRLAVRSITVDPSYNANTEHHGTPRCCGSRVPRGRRPSPSPVPPTRRS
jgi:secreted trypsin-like serine protease